MLHCLLYIVMFCETTHIVMHDISFSCMLAGVFAIWLSVLGSYHISSLQMETIPGRHHNFSSAVMQTVKNNLLADPALKQDVKEALEYASQQLATHDSLLNRLGELEKHIQQLEYQNAELRKQQGGVSCAQ